MRQSSIIVTAILILAIALASQASCPLDHFRIGCNEDSIWGTDDDMKLFFDCTEKYRHSDPNHSGDPTWLNWYYPLYYNERYDRYQIGEPGFDVIDESDPNRQLIGTPNADYRIIIECLDVAPDFSARNSSLGINMGNPGDWLNHSSLEDSHLHIQYRAPAPAGASEMQWITYIMYDALDDDEQYQPSEPLTVVFVRAPLSGDLVVDGTVDIRDLAELSYYWLGLKGSIENDFYERADINRNGAVDTRDYALLASNWLKSAD